MSNLEGKDSKHKDEVVDFAEFCDKHKTSVGYIVNNTVYSSVKDMVTEWRKEEHEGR